VLLGCLPALAARDNLLLNGGFEAMDLKQGPESWAVRTWDSRPDATLKVVPGGRFGARALQLEGKTHPLLFGCFSHPVTLSDPTPRQLLLALTYRTLKSPQADVSVTTFGEDFAQTEWATPVLTSEALLLHDSPAWRTVTWKITVMPGARQAVVMVRIHGAGTLWVDGVSLVAQPGSVTCEVLEAGTVTSLRHTRQCRVRLTSNRPERTTVNVTLTATALTATGPRGSAVQRVVLEPGRAQELTLPYSYALHLPHALQVLVTGLQPDEVLAEEKLRAPSLLDGTLLSPAFRATLLQSLPLEELVARGSLHAIPALRQGMRLTGRLAGSATPARNLPLGPEGQWELRHPATGLLAGQYGLQLIAYQGAAEVARLDLPIQRSGPRDAEAGYDDRLRLFVGGQPLFPMGLHYLSDEDQFTALSEAGFNTLILPSRLAGMNRVQALAQSGLRVVISSSSLESSFWRTMQEKFVRSPEVIGWYVLHKPATQMPPVAPEMMLDLGQRIAVLDPARPVLLAEASVSHLVDYVPACDVLMPWTEPEPPGDLRSVDVMLREAMAAAGGHKPVWPMLPLTGMAYSTDVRLDPKTTGRPPTPAEYRCMAFLALARGANGLFAHGHLVPAARNQRAYHVAVDAPPLWEMAQTVAAQVRIIAPILLYGEPVEITGDSPQVALRALRYREGTYILAANISAEASPLTFRVPSLTSPELQLAFDNRRLVSPQAGLYSEVLEPHGVRLYVGQ
jgi:hypothetical protein